MGKMKQFKTDNPILELLATGKQTGVVKQVQAQATQLVAEEKRLAELNLKKGVADRKSLEMIDAIKSDTLSAIDIEAAGIKAEIEKRRDAYQAEQDKHVTRHQFDLKVAELRYGASSSEELQQEMTRVLESEFVGDDSICIDALTIALKSHGLENEANSFREIMVARKYDQGWLQNTAADNLRAEREHLMSAKVGDVPLVTVSDSGKQQTGMLSIEDVITDAREAAKDD